MAKGLKGREARIYVTGIKRGKHISANIAGDTARKFMRKKQGQKASGASTAAYGIARSINAKYSRKK